MKKDLYESNRSKNQRRLYVHLGRPTKITDDMQKQVVTLIDDEGGSRMNICEMNKTVAIEFIQKHHYSPVMPRLTKHFLGAYVDGELVGVLTLGWGTQPRQTINKMFSNSTTADYFEIGKRIVQVSRIMKRPNILQKSMHISVSKDGWSMVYINMVNF